MKKIAATKKYLPFALALSLILLPAHSKADYQKDSLLSPEETLELLDEYNSIYQYDALESDLSIEDMSQYANPDVFKEDPTSTTSEETTLSSSENNVNVETTAVLKTEKKKLLFFAWLAGLFKN